MSTPASAPPPIVFLDVDGVLNTSQILKSEYEAGDPEVLFLQEVTDADKDKFMFPLKKALLRNLARVVAQTGCKIVISNTWRQDEELLAFLYPALEYVGIPRKAVIGHTPTHQKSYIKGRGAEIREYLDEHPDCSNWCIIDDDHVKSFTQHNMLDRFVRTHCQVMSGDAENEGQEEGLTEAKADAVIAILTSGQWDED